MQGCIIDQGKLLNQLEKQTSEKQFGHCLVADLAHGVALFIAPPLDAFAVSVLKVSQEKVISKCLLMPQVGIGYDKNKTTTETEELS